MGAIALFCFPMAPNESQQVSEDLTLKPHFDCVEGNAGLLFFLGAMLSAPC